MFSYTPLTRPKKPSRARQEAYKQKAPLLGPDLDVEGWQVFQDLEVLGKLFKQRHVSVALSVCKIKFLLESILLSCCIYQLGLATPVSINTYI